MTTLHPATGDARPPAGSPPAPASARRSTVRREIAVFLGTTAALLVASTAVAAGQDVDVRRIEDATPLGQAAMYSQAFFPLIAAVVARLAATGSLRRPGWGFRRTGPGSVGIAWLYALVTTVAGGAVLWVTGIAEFDGDGLTATVPLGLTVLVAPYALLALGEDIGWRGLLVARLAQLAGPRTVVLAGGLAWSAFHWPLIILLGGTPEGVPVWWALVMFTIGCTALGAVLASMQLRWGIWPGVVAHAVANATMYHAVEPLTREGDAGDWLGSETGLIPTVIAVAGAIVWWRFAPLVRGPGGTTRAAVRD